LNQGKPPQSQDAGTPQQQNKEQQAAHKVDQTPTMQAPTFQSQQRQDGTPPQPQVGDTLPGENVNTQPMQQQQQPSVTEGEDAYKQKYLTLQGKFNAEVPRLQQDNQRLNGLVDGLQREVERLKSLVETSQTRQDNGVQSQSTIDANAFDDYGPEFSNLAKTVTMLQAENTKLKQQVSNMSGDFQMQQQSQKQAAYNSYMSQVVSHVGALGRDFNQLNRDTDFLNWLRQWPEGESRQDKLRRAESNMDLVATKEIFDTYLGLAQAPAQRPKPNIQPKTANPEPYRTPPGTIPTGKFWTRADIKAFHDQKLRGGFKGREAEADALERDIHLATLEGRIGA